MSWRKLLRFKHLRSFQGLDPRRRSRFLYPGIRGWTIYTQCFGPSVDQRNRGRPVYKFVRGMGLAEIRTKHGWQITRRTGLYLHAEPPTSNVGDDPLIIQIDVPMQEQVLDVKRRIYANGPECSRSAS